MDLIKIGKFYLSWHPRSQFIMPIEKNTKQINCARDGSLCYAYQNTEPGAQFTNHICKTDKQQSVGRK